MKLISSLLILSFLLLNSGFTMACECEGGQGFFGELANFKAEAKRKNLTSSADVVFAEATSSQNSKKVTFKVINSLYGKYPLGKTFEIYNTADLNSCGMDTSIINKGKRVVITLDRQMINAEGKVVESSAQEGVNFFEMGALISPKNNQFVIAPCTYDFLETKKRFLKPTLVKGELTKPGNYEDENYKEEEISIPDFKNMLKEALK